MGLRIQAGTRGDRHVLVLNGELDVASAPVLERILEDLCAEGGAKEIVLDLGGVEFVDSSGLKAILRGKRLCQEHECAYTLTPAQMPVQRVFEITGVADDLPFRKSNEAEGPTPDKAEGSSGRGAEP